MPSMNGSTTTTPPGRTSRWTWPPRPKDSPPRGAARLTAPRPRAPATVPAHDWVSRRVTTNGVVSVAWQQVCLGAHYAGARCDVHVDGELLRFYIGDDLVKTAARTSRGEVRNKRAFRTREQA